MKNRLEEFNASDTESFTVLMSDQRIRQRQDVSQKHDCPFYICFIACDISESRYRCNDINSTHTYARHPNTWDRYSYYRNRLDNNLRSQTYQLWILQALSIPSCCPNVLGNRSVPLLYYNVASVSSYHNIFKDRRYSSKLSCTSTKIYSQRGTNDRT